MRKNFEYAQRIKSHYVDSDCVQMMVGNPTNCMTTIDEKSVVFHEKRNSNYYINNYLTDERALQFPYASIPAHHELVGFKKVKYSNQLFDFDKPYVSIMGNCIVEHFAVKDGNEAIMVTKMIIPDEEDKIINCDEFKALRPNYEDYNGILGSTGEIIYLDKLSPYEESLALSIIDSKYLELLDFKYKNLPSDFPLKKEILQKMKDEIKNMSASEKIKDIQNYYDPNFSAVVLQNVISVNRDNNSIHEIEEIYSEFVDENKYRTIIYKYPIQHYSLKSARQILDTSFLPTKEPRIIGFLNRGIDKHLIKEEKDKVKTLVRKPNKDNK